MFDLQRSLVATVAELSRTTENINDATRKTQASIPKLLG